jgi:hypothetical protein
MFEDRRARSFYVEAEWVKKPRHGQVQEFLSFKWNGESLWVAVIQAWGTKNWLEGYESGEGPQLLLTKLPRLDVVEVTALEEIAGRVQVNSAGERQEVIFEISSGSLAAEMF